MIVHYPNCRPDYPEKTPGEKPQATTDVDFGDGTVVRVCNDCGAHEMVGAKDPHGLDCPHGKDPDSCVDCALLGAI